MKFVYICYYGPQGSGNHPTLVETRHPRKIATYWVVNRIPIED